MEHEFGSELKNCVTQTNRTLVGTVRYLYLLHNDIKGYVGKLYDYKHIFFKLRRRRRWFIDEDQREVEL